MDTSGLPDHKPIRQSMYKTADVVIFCFSLAGLKIPKKRGDIDEYEADSIKFTSSHLSLRGIRNQWLPEVAEIIQPMKEDTTTEEIKIEEKEKEKDKDAEAAAKPA